MVNKFPATCRVFAAVIIRGDMPLDSVPDYLHDGVYEVLTAKGFFLTSTTTATPTTTTTKAPETTTTVKPEETTTTTTVKSEETTTYTTVAPTTTTTTKAPETTTTTVAPETTTTTTVKPAVPGKAKIAVTSGDTSFNYEITAPDSEGSAKIDYYTIDYTETGNPNYAHKQVTDLKGKVEGTSNDHELTVDVRAHNVVGDGEASDNVTVTPKHVEETTTTTTEKK